MPHRREENRQHKRGISPLLKKSPWFYSVNSLMQLTAKAYFFVDMGGADISGDVPADRYPLPFLKGVSNSLSHYQVNIGKKCNFESVVDTIQVINAPPSASALILNRRCLRRRLA